MLDRKTLGNAEDVTLVIDLDSETSHIRGKAIRQAAALGRKCGIIFVTSENAPQFKDVSSTAYITLPLSDLELDEQAANAIRGKSVELLSRFYFDSMLDKYKLRLRFEDYTITFIT